MTFARDSRRRAGRAALLWLGAACLGMGACSGEGGDPTGTSTVTTSMSAGGGGTTAMTGGGGTGGEGAGSTASTAGGGQGGTTGSGGATTTTTGTGGAGAACTDFAQRHGGAAPTDEAHLAGAVVSAGGGALVAGEILGSVTVGGVVLASAGAADAFVAGLAESGALAWARRFGSVYDDRVKAIAALPDGGAVLAGTFDGVVDFGGTTLTSIAGPDAFVLRIDGTGKTVFALQFENADARAVAVAPEGDVFVAGDFVGSSTFGGIALTSAQNDVFVARVTVEGSVVAAHSYSFPAKPGALAIAAGDSGAGVYVAGSFQGTIDLGLGSMTSAGSKDILLARLDAASLDATLAQQWGDDTSQEARAVAVLADGGAAIAGAFRGTLDFNGQTLVADTQDDAFVARLTPGGEVVFARRFGDAAEQGARAIAAAPGGELLVAGGFQGKLDAGDGAIVSAGGFDVFLARLDPETGIATKTTRWGDVGDQRARAVSADPCGAVLVAGDFAGSLPWGGQALNATGALDVFVARVAP